MKSSHRAIVLLTALTLVLVSPDAASAKPTSTYTLAYSQSDGVHSSSSRLTLDETGTGVLHFNETDFEMITCPDGGIGSVSSVYSVNGPLATVEFEVDRKLSAFYWRGSAEVTQTVTTFCPTTGPVRDTASEQGIFEAVGASSSRMVRSRVDGARLLTSVLDSLTVETPTSSFNGVGTLTETISRS